MIKIRNSRHLKSVIYTDLEEDIPHFEETDDENETKKVLDRYTLLAFYNSSIPDCLEYLYEQLLYPWPFAGYSGLSSDKSDGMWWEETMIVGLVDVQYSPGSRELGKDFGIKEMSSIQQCPSIGFIPSRGSIDDRIQAQYFHNHDDYAKFVCKFSSLDERKLRLFIAMMSSLQGRT